MRKMLRNFCNFPPLLIPLLFYNQMLKKNYVNMAMTTTILLYDLATTLL